MREDQTKQRTTLTELLETLARRIALEDLRVSMPATVTKYYPATVGEYGQLPAMVEVELDHRYAREGFADDAEEDEEFKEIPERLDGKGELVGPWPAFVCPVHYPGPATMWSRGAMTIGEQGLVIWTDRDLGRWLVAARDGGATVDPGYGYAHGGNLSASVFLPGLASGPQWPADVPEEGGKIGPRDGSSGLHMGSAGVTLDSDAAISIAAAAEVTIDGTTVKLGEAAAAVIALLPELKAPLAALALVYQGLPGLTYATDIVPIKAGWATFATNFAALVGSVKGRG